MEKRFSREYAYVCHKDENHVICNFTKTLIAFGSQKEEVACAFYNTLFVARNVGLSVFENGCDVFSCTSMSTFEASQGKRQPIHNTFMTYVLTIGL